MEGIRWALYAGHRTAMRLGRRPGSPCARWIFEVLISGETLRWDDAWYWAERLRLFDLWKLAKPVYVEEELTKIKQFFFCCGNFRVLCSRTFLTAVTIISRDIRNAFSTSSGARTCWRSAPNMFIGDRS